MTLRFRNKNGEDVKPPVTFARNMVAVVPMVGDHVDTGAASPLKIVKRTFTYTPLLGDLVDTTVDLTLDYAW